MTSHSQPISRVNPPIRSGRSPLSGTQPTSTPTLQHAASVGRRRFERYSREFLEAFRAASRPQFSSHTTPRLRHQLENFHKYTLAALWIGHATLLLRLGSTTILTDPVMCERIGFTLDLHSRLPPITFGLSRLAPPAISIPHLPPIDLILISHAHFDHLDRPSLSKLAHGPAAGATIITARNTTRLIPRVGFSRIVELNWNSSFHFADLHIDALRPVHWGARTGLDHHRGWNAYVLRSSSHSILFAGDTAFTDAFSRISPVDLAIFGIGAYNPWNSAHANPEQVWQMFRDSRAARLAPMHHSTFLLGDEPLHEPLQRLRKAAANSQDQLVCQNLGDPWIHSPAYPAIA